MSRLTVTGIVCCLASAVVLGFQAITTLMDPSASSITRKSMAWKKITIVGLIGKSNLEWINTISWESIQNLLNSAVNMPLYLLLLGIGIFCLILGVATSKE